MRRTPEILFSILSNNGFTVFQIRVYKKVCTIPWGCTRSYEWIARAQGRPRAARAVGQALKRNPFPLVIPCHRVVGKDGAPGGFSKGRDIKKRLLELEKAAIIGKTDD